MKRVLFIDRDGTLIKEHPPTYQIDSWEKLEFYPYAITYMHKIATELDHELVMVSNQDGLGTNKFLEEDLQDRFAFIEENDRIYEKKVVTDPGASAKLRAGQIISLRELREENSLLRRTDK